LGDPPVDPDAETRQADRRVGTAADCLAETLPGHGDHHRARSVCPSSVTRNGLGEPPTRALKTRGAPIVSAPSLDARSTNAPAASKPQATDVVLSLAPSELEGRRGELARVADECVDAAWAPATRRTYERQLKVWIGEAEVELGWSLLPLDSTEKLIAVFARMDGQSWRTIQTNEAAVRAWHALFNLASAFDALWDDRARLFWQG